MSLRLRSGFAALLLTVGLLPLRSAGAEEAVLLASTASGYVPGMVVRSADRINLPNGASVLLLFRSGEIMRLGGPFDGTLSPPNAAAGATLADLFRLRGADATVIGGTRSAGGYPAPIDEVLVDPGRSATYCVESSTSVWVARPAGGRDYAIRGNGGSRALRWPRDADRVEWPADVPIEDGDQFMMKPDQGPAVTATFRVIETGRIPAAARLAKGIFLGCREQFEPEMRQLTRSVAQPELWMTTDRGREPLYRPGEAVTLTAMANLDGYLYCFTIGAAGNARAVFPAGAVDGAEIHGSTPLVIPSRRQGAKLSYGPDLQQIRCWLADRNIARDMPPTLLGDAAAIIPARQAATLDEIFARIGGARIETDTLVIGAAPD